MTDKKAKGHPLNPSSFSQLPCHQNPGTSGPLPPPSKLWLKNSSSKLWRRLTNAVSPLHNSGITSCCYRMGHKVAANSLPGTHTRHKIHSSQRNTACKSALKIHFGGSSCNKKGGFGVCGKRHFVSGGVLRTLEQREGVCHTSTTNFVATSVPFSYWILPTFSPSAFVFDIVKLWCSVRVRLSYWDKFYHNSINQDAEGGNGDRTVSYNLAALRAIHRIVISIAMIHV